MSQEIIFTTLPNQLKEVAGKKWLQLSVFVSIRLTPLKDTTLSSFEDILNWPEKILNSKYQFRFQPGLVTDGELLQQKIDKDLYKNLFHKNIRVKGFLQEDLSMKRINSFPLSHVHDFLVKNYLQTAIESPKNKPTADIFIDEDRLGVISQFRLDENEINKINDPQRMRTPLKSQNLMLKKGGIEPDHKRILRANNFVSFAKKINPESDFAQFRSFHKLDRDKKIRRIDHIRLKKPEFEFHDILAVVNNYPQLMRKFGFVLDFQIPLNDTIPLNGTFHVIPGTLGLSDASTTISAPPVAYEITKTGFYIADKPDTIFKRGFVKINTEDFSVVQVDADGVAIKTNNLTENKVHQIAKFFENKSNLIFNNTINISNSQSIRQLQIEGLPISSGARLTNKMSEVEPPEDEGLPAMRSSGIAITKNGMAEHIFSRFKNNVNLQTGLLTAAPLHADFKIRIPINPLYSSDLVQGYRMDIAYESDPEKWYSLHQRKDEYTWFNETNQPNIITGIEPDEGFIELAIAVDHDDPNDVFVSETLARWEGWSLSVRKPGYSINESEDYELKSGETLKRDFVNKDKTQERKKYAFDPDLEFKINAQSNILPGTLPKLRFGKDYRIRIRTVDLAGNSVLLTQQSEDITETVRKNIRYMRFEPLASPIVLIGNQLKDGEFLERMVIRSNFDAGTKDYENKFPVNHKVFDEFSQRFLLPPKNSQAISETHGMFEKAFSNNPDAVKEIYQLITSHEGLYKQDKKNNEKVYQPSEVEIIYLPDPMAAGVALFVAEGCEHTHTQEFKPRMFGFFTNDEVLPSNTNLNIPENWYKAGILRIRLEEGEIGSKWDSSQRIFTVFLPKGYRTRLKFSTFWREKDFKELSGLWGMMKEKSPSNLSELEQLVGLGQHWMLTPSREMELIHAVQQPVAEPVIQALIPERDYGDTSANINTRFSVHGESTGKVEYQAKWSEFYDDGISLTIKQIQGTNSIPDITVSYVDDLITKGTIPTFPKLEIQENPKLVFQPHRQFQRRSLTEFKINPQPESVRVNILYKIQSSSFEKLKQEKLVAPKSLSNTLKFDIHESRFSFLKHIELRIEPLIQNFGDTKHRWVDYKIVASSRYREYFDKILSQYSNQHTVRESQWVEKVNILSTTRPKIPEIDYIIPTFEWHKTQDQNTIRHQRLSGGLRIFLKRPWFSTGDDEMLGVILPPTPSKAPNIAAIPTGYTGYFTHWGIDPLHNSTQPDLLSPALQDFRMNPTFDENVQYPDMGKTHANVVAYPVIFDEERQQWFCDLAINTRNMYFPFIKLALARYQPHSVHKGDTDVCLSPVVMADMMQLMPDRTSVIQFKKEDVNSKFSVSVTGVIYSDISNPFKMYNYIRISLVDSRIGQPIYGFVDDGVNARDLRDEKVEIEITEREVANNRFKVTTDFRLPHAYKTSPFQVIIEEFERGPKKMKVADGYENRVEQSEETDRLVYADVFKINETK